jgi:hypothetical protein
MANDHEQAEEFSWGIVEYMKNHQLAIGILLTTFGFIYQVIGAWPLWDKAYPWEWQTEIAMHWGFLIWPLFIISLVALVIGIALLYEDSKRYHERYPELILANGKRGM